MSKCMFCGKIVNVFDQKFIAQRIGEYNVHLSCCLECYEKETNQPMER